MSKGTALITGASSGIGAELAKICAADGYNVVLVARSVDKLSELAFRLTQQYKISARAVAADLAQAAAPQSIFEQTRGEIVEILINNAGFGIRGEYASSDWDVQRDMIQVNLVALAHLTSLYLPLMVQRRSGRILNVSSIAGFVPGPLMSMYYATKAFVTSFSLAIANEVAGSGVSVTVLCPGPTATKFVEKAGIQESKLFEKSAMSAEEVARGGYDAMMKGRPEVITGAKNRLMMLGARIAPRAMLASISRGLNSNAK
jgi:short-subunit dehydrogenase